MADRTVHATITGRVQGVGFRAWLADEARERGLNGWVRNRDDGSVEALLAGEADTVGAMLEVCRKGPPGATVTELHSADTAEPPELGFRILPTA